MPCCGRGRSWRDRSPVFERREGRGEGGRAGEGGRDFFKRLSFFFNFRKRASAPFSLSLSLSLWFLLTLLLACASNAAAAASSVSSLSLPFEGGSLTALAQTGQTSTRADAGPHAPPWSLLCSRQKTPAQKLQRNGRKSRVPHPGEAQTVPRERRSALERSTSGEEEEEGGMLARRG